MSVAASTSLFSRHYIDYVYIPAALLIVGTLVVKRDWTPYSVAIALAFGTFNFYKLRESAPWTPSSPSPIPSRSSVLADPWWRRRPHPCRG